MRYQCSLHYMSKAGSEEVIMSVKCKVIYLTTSAWPLLVMQQDNGPKHNYKSISKWLQKMRIKKWQWSSQSPDLKKWDLKEAVHKEIPANVHLCNLVKETGPNSSTMVTGTSYRN